MKRISVVLPILVLTQSACMVVGYSSRGGWFLWPGGLGLIIIILLLLFFFRGR